LNIVEVDQPLVAQYLRKISARGRRRSFSETKIQRNEGCAGVLKERRQRWEISYGVGGDVDYKRVEGRMDPLR
jgi:hypothetical protein